MNDQAISFLRRRILVRHHPSAFLLGAQLLSLLFYAAYDEVHSGRALLGAFSVIVLALSVWVVNRSPAANWIAWVIAIPAFLLSLLFALFVDPRLLVWSALLQAALYFYTAGSLIAYMMEDYRVTTGRIVRRRRDLHSDRLGIRVRISGLSDVVPRQLRRRGASRRAADFLEILFLSFTNLSATGLGDILPMTSPARVLVMLEQFVGIAYIVVVVSRLIGLTIAPPRAQR